MPETHRPAPFAADATPDLPLARLILLAVEDSRLACDALRLLAQRAGARMRRAETLAEAGRHLCVYRPDLVLVDPGLPDGDGLTLVARLRRHGPAAPPALVISGLPELRGPAMAAGAAGFMAKPIPSLAAFAEAVLDCLPGRLWREVVTGSAPLPRPDPLALQDDLARAARQLSRSSDDRERLYVARFVAGVARSAGDTVLAEAARRIDRDPQAIGALARALAERLAATPPTRLIAPG